MKKTDLEKDLGVYISDDRKPSRLVSVVAAKANRIVGLMKKNVDYLDAETVLVIHYQGVTLDLGWDNRHIIF